MARRLTDLAAVLRAAGCPVIEVPGWQDRGRPFTVAAVVWHHTATGPAWSDSRVADLLRLGRSDLPGPLAQLGLDRRGRYWLIAAGKANHNGYGLHGNNAIGIEAYNSGLGEPWPTAQVSAYVRGSAALARAYRVPVASVLGHKETDPRRKIDPTGLHMPTMRHRVATPAPTPSPSRGFLMALTDKQQAELYAAVMNIKQNAENGVKEGRQHHADVTNTVRAEAHEVRVRTNQLRDRLDDLLAIVKGLKP